MPRESERSRHGPGLAALATALALVLAGPFGPARALETATPARLGPPPAADSEEQKADLAVVLWLQRTRAPGEVVRAAAAARLSLSSFAGALEREVEGPKVPLTSALLENALEAVRAETGPLKKRHARLRPFATDPRIAPVAEKEASFSYPSGHATLGVVWAGVLAALRPERAEALRLRGLQIGNDRVLAGVHWPSDVEAGQRLGAIILERLRADAAFQVALEQARVREWAGS